ncbi:protease [Xanthobacter sp. V4C-4]|uniref:HdeD family acid-resistance protein n=1 Tax=Xanthobacter cornucopiae TaxID=3119924 RepID=UPI003726B6CE
MFELLFLLVGGPTLRRKWWVVAVVGAIWLAIGILLMVDALLETLRFPARYFAIPLAIMAAVSFGAAFASASATHRALRFIKAGMCVVMVLLIVDAPWHSDILVGLLVGSVLIIDATWRAGSAYVVRFPRWRTSMALAGLEFLLGLWSFVPWPTHWRGEVGTDVAQLIIVAALGVCAMALRIRRLPHGASLAAILAQTRPDRDGTAAQPLPPGAVDGDYRDTLTVHVWTPTGGLAPINHGVQRYVVAQDPSGVASTGHAALEMPPDLYISHYPAVEIDRSPEQFARVLRATLENDVPGTFKPNYAAESAEWCPSTMQVHLTGVNGTTLRRFWNAYRQDSTYNLTYRNCSSAVAMALDAGLEGRFAREAASLLFLLRLLSLPELWIAGLMRRRAAWMAWTPGMVLDYSRALSGILAIGGGRHAIADAPRAPGRPTAD